MKKKIISIFASLLLIVTSLVGCFTNNEKNYANVEVTRDGQVSELTYSELTGLINGNATFIVIYGDRYCGSCIDLKEKANEFIKAEYQRVYYLASNDLTSNEKKEVGNYLKLDSPTTHIFVSNTSKAGEAKSKLVKYKAGEMTTTQFTELIRGYIAPNPPVLSYAEVKAKIANNEEFILLIARADCGTCKMFYQNFFNPWYIRNYKDSKIYMFDTTEVYIRTPRIPGTDTSYALIEDVTDVELEKFQVADAKKTDPSVVDDVTLEIFKEKIRNYIAARGELKFQWTPVMHLVKGKEINTSYQYLDNNYYMDSLTISYDNFIYSYQKEAKEKLTGEYKSLESKKIAMEEFYYKSAKAWLNENEVKK